MENEKFNAEFEINTLKRQVASLRRQVVFHNEWLETVNSPLYKRIWWWIRGYRFYTVGRWYGKNDNLK